ncbi:MAG: hydrogenobyrinic acid a,c-diamide synthase (glutamine-hydrolyzing) [Desulfitobacterium hafniense]|nr:hydrogenobyrinic acid a,c-diamide synthase (glutamine-hydrolyzing) [Desulfitobacterium hafniense]
MLPIAEQQGQISRNVTRLIIGAPQGRSGKTTFTLGLLRALSRQGKSVQPFKKGPDYIDPSWHTAAAGRTCRNLDSFFMNKEEICRSLLDSSQEEGISIIEGAMGLFDGLDLEGSSSTAEIAKITKSPVLLVVDATRMTRSIAAMVMGYQNFDPDVKICGVILNKVARARHERLARESIEHFCKIPVVGAIPKDAMLTIPDRHLGLVTNGEMNENEELLDYLADVISKHVDLDRVCQLAEEAPELSIPQRINISSLPGYMLKTNPKLRVGVIKDKSFSFYYPENLEALENLGAEIVIFSSIEDSTLPKDLDALYIGGGFPEVFAAEIEKNTTLRQEIRIAAENGLPIYAECGGLMYLGRTIKVNDSVYDMVGLLPFDTQMESKPQGHGYTIMEVSSGNAMFKPGTIIRGHEFHNSRIINIASDVVYAYRVKRGHGFDGEHDGICYKNVVAAYNHIHASGCPEWAENFLSGAVKYRTTRWSQRERVAGE